MQGNPFAYEFHHLASSFPNRHATREVWHVCAIAGLALFHHHQIFHNPTLVGLEARLLEDTIQRSLWHVNAQFTGNSDRAGLHRVAKLPVTTFGTHVSPPVCFDELYSFADFHGTTTVRAA